MTRSTIWLGAVVLSFLSALASPASAQHVITNPGKCAQFYPNANCQNYGRGNPTRAMAGSGRDIVTTGAIGITAAIGTDAHGRA
jgi:hypothetical protein